MKLVAGTMAVRVILAVVLVAVTVVPVILIKNAVTDKVDEVSKEVGFENVPANPTDIDSGQSLYREGNFKKAMAALEEAAGDNPELLKVGVLPYMAEFQVKSGDGAKGYRFYAKNGEIGAFKVKIVGSGSIEGQQFPYETLRPGITQKLESSVKGKGGDVKVTNMNLEKGLTGGPLAWSVNAESDSRTGLVYQAKPDGSGLADPTEFAGVKGDNGGMDMAACVQKAQGDVAKIQACSQ